MKKLILLFYIMQFSIANAQNLSLQWAKQIGGINNQFGNSITVDGNLNMFITGIFSNTVDFDPGPGIYNLTSGGIDAFICKLDSSGNFIWAKQFLPSAGNMSEGYKIVVDPTGNLYTTGGFEGTVDFDPGSGIFNLISSGFGRDIYICKLDSGGNFIWAKQFGGTQDDLGTSIALDLTGNIHTTGWFQGIADFDPGAVDFNMVSSGSYDIFVSKLDSSGTFMWAKSTGGLGDDEGWSIILDESENVYITGHFENTVDFDPNAGIFNLTTTPLYYFDIFINKLDSTGNFIWAKQMGGVGDDIGYSIDTDHFGNVYTTGSFNITSDFDPGIGVLQLASNGGEDIFVNKIDSSGNFLWARSMGGGNHDRGNSLDLDAAGNIFITGYFEDTVDFDPDTSIYNLESFSYWASDIFVSKLDTDGNFEWAKSVGGAERDEGLSISVDFAGNVLSTGYFKGTVDFDPDSGVVILASPSNFDTDVFIQKLGTFSTGLQDFVSDPTISINVYPNPTNGDITVEGSSILNLIIVMEVTGKELSRYYPNSTKSIIPMGEISKGIYLLKIINDTDSYPQFIPVISF